MIDTPNQLSQRAAKPYFRIVILLLFAWFLLTLNVDAGWFGHHDSSGAMLHIMARNYRYYSAAKIGFMPVTNYAPTTPDNYQYHTHHPFLTAWTMGAAAGLFGMEEITFRFAAACATMIAVVAFFVLCRRLYGTRWAWWSAVFLVLTPMVAYFGRMPHYAPFALMYLMLFSGELAQWLRRPTRRRWLALAIFALCAVWTSWATVFFLVGFGLLVMWAGTNYHRVRMVILGIVTLAGVVLYVLYYQTQRPDTIEDLANTFLWRSSATSVETLVEHEVLAEVSPDVTFTTVEWITQQFVDLFIFVTPGVLLLSVAGVAPAWRRGTRLGRGFLVALSGSELVYLLVFRNASFVHDFYKIYLIPAAAITAAAALLAGWSNPQVKRWARPTLVGLLATSVIFGGAMLYKLHTVNSSEQLSELAQAIATHTTQDELVIANFDDWKFTLGYYTARHIDFDVAADQALERAGREPVALYVFCTEADTGYPNALAPYNYQAVGDCRLYDLRESPQG
jgi:4-amino-4-deoxy-L-arabinose transferase-like glycosyltransferase